VPLLLEMSVAKPWMLASPDPEMSHSLAGLPGLEFSHGIRLAIDGSQGSAACTGLTDPPKRRTKRAVTATRAGKDRRPRAPREAASIQRERSRGATGRV